MGIYQGFYKRIKWLSEFLNKIVGIILAGLSVPLVAIVLYAVFTRYVLRKGPSWSEEITRYLMVWLGLLAASIALKKGEHIGLRLVVERVFFSFKKQIVLVADFLVLAFFSLVFVEGVFMTLFVAPQRSPSANLPMWVPYMAVPVGSLLLIIQALFLILEKFEKPPSSGKEK